MENAEITGTKYLLYRCFKCGRPLTCLQIQAVWASASKDSGKSPPLCSCGSSHISPGNAKWWEELLYPSIWKIWYHFVLKPWYKKRFAA